MPPDEGSQRARAPAAVKQFGAIKRGFGAIPDQLPLDGFARFRLTSVDVGPQHDQPLAGPIKIAPGTASRTCCPRDRASAPGYVSER